jgi:hypothetical protein
MSAQLIAFIIFALMLSGMALGSYLRLILPDEHTQADSKDILMTAAATMGTLIALIIGLLVTSAKSTYDETNSSITQGGAKIITLDYYLSQYGPEAKELRVLLRQSTAAAIERIWPDKGAQGTVWAKIVAADETADLYNKIRQLAPQNDGQKYLQTQALQIAADMMQTRWMLIEQSQVNLPRMFLSVLSFWLIVLFVQFGLLAPRNRTAHSAVFICALSMAGAIFLILELNHPLEGRIKISSAPMQKVLAVIGK